MEAWLAGWRDESCCALVPATMGRAYGVTGAAGLLGFSVLKLLAREKADEIETVKAFDLFFSEDLKSAIESESSGKASADRRLQYRTLNVVYLF